MNFTPSIEFATQTEIISFQENKLLELLRYVSEKSKYYQSVFAANTIDVKNIKTISDLQSIPFTSKDDLAKFNTDFLCVDKNTIADYVTTSGTTNEPVTFYLTTNDLERLAYNEAISLCCADGSENDIYQLTITIDKQFMAGLAYFLGIRKLNAGLIRTGPGMPYLQWESIQRFSPTVLIAIPSFIPKLISYAIEHNINYKNTSVKSIISIGEPIRNKDFSLNELGKRILSQWDVKLYSTYASTEMGAAFTECKAGRGGHHHPELLLLEVLDENGKAVSEGELGEIVITTLGVEGMPLLRYKTGDLCHVYYSTCDCGRNTIRLGPVVGRKQQMIKFKGTTIFPPAIFDVLDKLSAIEIYQVEVSRNEFGNDNVTVLIPQEIQSEEFEEELQSLFKSKLRVTPAIKFLPANELSIKIFNPVKRKPEKIIYI
ncbi:MAG: AMP-binding protein [Bacteroidia bacterium]|nr:AMP-binding protein [Bacteroidia bacterium]